MANDVHELDGAINSPDFISQKTVVGKLLYVLSIVYVQRKSDFDKVLTLNKGKRTYFSKSERAIEKSGSSPVPQNIPGSPFWVLTKTSTDVKRKMLGDTLRLLRYDDAAISAAVSSLV